MSHVDMVADGGVPRKMMTLEEAISHCNDVINRCKHQERSERGDECIGQHFDLMFLLGELQDLRAFKQRVMGKAREEARDSRDKHEARYYCSNTQKYCNGCTKDSEG